MNKHELKQYSAYAHNPHWNNPLYLKETNTVFNDMRKWQKQCLYEYAINKKGVMERFLSVQAFCGSGKSVLQVHLAIYDILASKHTQKQLIAVPQQHIHRGFVGEGDLDYLSVYQDDKEYQWSIQAEHNFCDGKDRVDNLVEWLLTPSKNLAKGFTDNTIGGLNAICSHAALIAAWNKLTLAEQKIAIQNTSFRIDEAHHIKNVFLDVEELEEKEKILIDYEATELGRFCKYIINSPIKTSKLHLTTATMYRGDRHMILSKGRDGRDETWKKLENL